MILPDGFGWYPRRMAVVLAFLVLLGPVAPALALDSVAVVGSLISQGDALIADYTPQRGGATADALSSLYFDGFEGSGLEAELGAREPERKTDLESRFSRTISLAMRGAPPADVALAWQQLRSGLAEVGASQRGGAASAGTVALEAFLILVREGLEALLVVSTIAAYVRRRGLPGQVRLVGRSVAWAVLASLVTAVAASRLLSLGGPGQEALEGVTVLLAAAVLFYVSCWLFAKREAGRWQAYLQEQVGQAISSGRGVTLGLAVFLAVYREGAETVLFYQALALANPGQGWALAGGLGAAVIALLLIYRAMNRLSQRLPLGLFFTGTATLLYALSVVFVGQGVLELQEARWVPATTVAWLPQISWLGLFPTVESAGAQALVLASSLAAAWWLGGRPMRGGAANG